MPLPVIFNESQIARKYFLVKTFESSPHLFAGLMQRYAMDSTLTSCRRKVALNFNARLDQECLLNDKYTHLTILKIEQLGRHL